MGVFPVGGVDGLPVISTMSQESMGNYVAHVSGGGVAFVTAANVATGTTNLAFFVPFSLSKPYTAKMMFHYNGTTATGNIDVGIYDRAGTKIVSKGSTAMSGAATFQTFDITDTYLTSGLYYFAVAFSSATGTMAGFQPGSVILARAGGIAQMGSAFALPATATFASMSLNVIPLIGMSNRTFI